MTDQPLDPRAITVERFGGAILTAVVGLGGGVGVLVTAVTQWGDWFWVLAALVLWILIVIGLAGLAWYFPERAHAATRWTLDDRGLEIRRGIWWRSITTVPRLRVQHTDVQQGPLQRQYGLGKLVVYTAGTQNASVELDGLAFETAQRLKDILVADRDGVHEHL